MVVDQLLFAFVTRASAIITRVSLSALDSDISEWRGVFLDKQSLSRLQ